MKEAFDSWNVSDAQLLRTNPEKGAYASVDVAAAAQKAEQMLGIQAGEKTVIPLHDHETPAPTNEYVLWRPGTESVGWFDTGFGISGSKRFVSVDEIANTEVAHRLRFWAEADPDDAKLDVEFTLPPETISSVSSLSRSQQDSFFSELTEFVQEERRTNREANWESYTELGLENAIERHRATGPFAYVGTGRGEHGFEGLRYQLGAEDGSRNADDVDLRGDEGLFGGNYCIVDIDIEGNLVDDALPIPAEILEVDGQTLLLRPEWEEVADRNVVEKHLQSSSVDLWVSELLNPVPYERQIDAIRQVKRHAGKRGLITGSRDIEFEPNEYAIPNPDIDLNEDQHKALTWAASAGDVFCIHGPPGTGKTRTLTAYVQHAVSKGQRVLVTAHSNQAVDNVLVGDSSRDEPEPDTLHAMAQDADSPVQIARVGNNSRSQIVRSKYCNKPVSEANVVAATTSGASQFDQNSFDVAVVDEATQASRPSTAIVLNCADKLVLAGDHKQLPPYCADETMQDEDIHVSLFEYLLERYGPEVSVLLRTQYRMNEAIAQYPNEAFYDGELRTADFISDWTIGNLEPITGIDVAGDERRESPGNSIYNPREAETVARQVEILITSGVEPEDIGVISAYSGQKRAISQRVNQLDVDTPEKVTVDTVDSFQGGEREAIVVSFVRSNEEGHSGFLEFPDEGPRRLNVALTRARKRLVVVGDWETLGSIAPHRTAGQSCAEYYARLASYLREHNNMLAAKSTTGE